MLMFKDGTQNYLTLHSYLYLKQVYSSNSCYHHHPVFWWLLITIDFRSFEYREWKRDLFTACLSRGPQAFSRLYSCEIQGREISQIMVAFMEVKQMDSWKPLISKFSSLAFWRVASFCLSYGSVRRCLSL